ncbi:MAG: hypothetical protein SVY10_21660 [Thermodesulfobacteriota bacterium]|nr:hypothetical protein [Thermodesulfobacteriota bacterium]
MRDHTKLRAFESADVLGKQDSSLIESNIMGTEKVLNGLIMPLKLSGAVSHKFCANYWQY